ncbi:hypothetical protein [Lederbergia citrea]|uniref:hypothetical protein n=1 Tax=Lederbergia citrea TaxID=2833581 RepID=UPI001BC8F093|nr:hypothetical protein [Lederbergia citrea]MBS4176882.1 hypothetical protein [Lederbergia citrea]
MKKSILFLLTINLAIALIGCSNKETVQDSKSAQSKQKFIIVDSVPSSEHQENGYIRSSGLGKESSGQGYIPNFNGETIHLLRLN